MLRVPGCLSPVSYSPLVRPGPSPHSQQRPREQQTIKGWDSINIEDNGSSQWVANHTTIHLAFLFYVINFNLTQIKWLNLSFRHLISCPCNINPALYHNPTFRSFTSPIKKKVPNTVQGQILKVDLGCGMSHRLTRTAQATWSPGRWGSSGKEHLSISSSKVLWSTQHSWFCYYYRKRLIWTRALSFNSLFCRNLHNI